MARCVWVGVLRVGGPVFAQTLATIHRVANVPSTVHKIRAVFVLLFRPSAVKFCVDECNHCCKEDDELERSLHDFKSLSIEREGRGKGEGGRGTGEYTCVCVSLLLGGNSHNSRWSRGFELIQNKEKKKQIACVQLSPVLHTPATTPVPSTHCLHIAQCQIMECHKRV